MCCHCVVDVVDDVGGDGRGVCGDVGDGVAVVSIVVHGGVVVAGVMMSDVGGVGVSICEWVYGDVTGVYGCIGGVDVVVEDVASCVGAGDVTGDGVVGIVIAVGGGCVGVVVVGAGAVCVGMHGIVGAGVGVVGAGVAVAVVVGVCVVMYGGVNGVGGVVVCCLNCIYLMVARLLSLVLVV